jgi:hypothetical protein
LNRGIITHLLNSLGMLADHHVIDIGWGASGFAGCQRDDGRRPEPGGE